MSAEVGQEFFPVVFSIAESQPLLGKILISMFPHYIGQLCPLPFLTINAFITLKWPAVALACILGCVGGFLSGGYLVKHSICRRRENRFFAWGCALTWYAVMCLGGLVHHCIHPTPIFYVIDVIGTGCSSLSVVGGSLITQDAHHAWRFALLISYVLIAMSAVFGTQIVREMLYLGPTFVAFVFGGWFAWRIMKTCGEGKREEIGKWVTVAVSGAIAGIGGVVCDPWLCLLFGSNFSMLFWLFVGCDVAIFAFFPIVLILHQPDVKYLKAN
eukprot:Gb_09173 [translate_table: standard]